MATEWKCMSKINSKDTSCFLFNFSESIPLPANIYLFKVTIEILKKGEKHVQINKKKTPMNDVSGVVLGSLLLSQT